MAASSVAVIIPPSIGMIIYGAVTGTSVGELYSAGFIPGIVYGLAFMVYSYFYAKRKKDTGAEGDGPRSLSRLQESRLGPGVSGGGPGRHLRGICTPTEAAGIGCIYSVVGVFIYKEMSLRDLVDEAFKSAVDGPASDHPGRFERLCLDDDAVPDPGGLADAIMAYGSKAHGPDVMNIIMLIAGMLIDPASFQMILAPLFLPLAKSVGVDPVHLGIIMVVNGAIGMFTPPFGLNLFVATSITKIPLGS